MNINTFYYILLTFIFLFLTGAAFADSASDDPMAPPSNTIQYPSPGGVPFGESNPMVQEQEELKQFEIQRKSQDLQLKLQQDQYKAIQKKQQQQQQIQDQARQQRVQELYKDCQAVDQNQMDYQQRSLCQSIQNHIQFGMPLNLTDEQLGVQPQTQ